MIISYLKFANVATSTKMSHYPHNPLLQVLWCIFVWQPNCTKPILARQVAPKAHTLECEGDPKTKKVTFWVTLSLRIISSQPS